MRALARYIFLKSGPENEGDGAGMAVNRDLWRPKQGALAVLLMEFLLDEMDGKICTYPDETLDNFPKTAKFDGRKPLTRAIHRSAEIKEHISEKAG